MRYFLELSYKGTSYNGWQKQPDAPSVQGALEKALSTILREQTSVTGAGRTDTGVHAAYYTAHFDTLVHLEEKTDFTYHLNCILPHDIAVSRVTRVADEAHARFDAMEREYKYYILPFKEPFRKESTWQYFIPLDINKMNEAAEALCGEHEFTTFSKLHSANKTDLCNVMTAYWEAGANGELIFTIRADRFLRNMVRAIVGTLADVGRGKISVPEFISALRAKDRSLASGSAPAQGLFLNDVVYNPDIFKSMKS